MQRRRNRDFEISSLPGFADEWLNSCACSCVTALIGSRVSCSYGPQGKQAARCERVDGLRGQRRPRVRWGRQAIGARVGQGEQLAVGLCIRPEGESRCTSWVWGSGVRGGWDRGWWGVGVKYEDQGYIWGMARGKYPRNHSNALIAFKETKPCTIMWLSHEGSTWDLDKQDRSHPDWTHMCCSRYSLIL